MQYPYHSTFASHDCQGRLRRRSSPSPLKTPARDNDINISPETSSPSKIALQGTSKSSQSSAPIPISTPSLLTQRIRHQPSRPAQHHVTNPPLHAHGRQETGAHPSIHRSSHPPHSASFHASSSPPTNSPIADSRTNEFPEKWGVETGRKSRTLPTGKMFVR
ncbi:hypothetical protein BU16DRAFT_530866 [Lophium mytilinum]|uniref:Uncharacterized protein n=1 Tax=Lophium mytilinum TaxID=390894 RepID=A0A6A6QDZ7_9PEZI|nr:hypothetical protein BU16DRAFT_530866 [Lophium mytilinum]